MIHRLALIGEPPESRGHQGPGIPPVIDRNARIEAFVTVDAGIERATTIGRSWAMKHVHCGHDAQIGDGCELAPHVVVGGYVTIGDNVKIGMGAIIRNRITVGDNARIGMGAVVTKDVPEGMTVIGNPAHDITEDPRIDPLWHEWWRNRG